MTGLRWSGTPEAPNDKITVRTKSLWPGELNWSGTVGDGYEGPASWMEQMHSRQRPSPSDPSKCPLVEMAHWLKYPLEVGGATAQPGTAAWSAANVRRGAKAGRRPLTGRAGTRPSRGGIPVQMGRPVGRRAPDLQNEGGPHAGNQRNTKPKRLGNASVQC